MNPYLLLLLAVACISFGSVFVRLAQAPALAIAFYRIAFASLLVAPFTLRSAARAWPTLDTRSSRVANEEQYPANTDILSPPLSISTT